MAAQGAMLEVAEREAVVAWLTDGQEDYSDWAQANRCEAAMASLDDAPLHVGSWGLGRDNHRVQTQSALTRTNAGTLKEAWSLAFPGVGTMRSQPVILGDTLFLAVADAQTVYALDRNLGCVHWSHAVGSSPRTALTHAELDGRSVLLFGDTSGFVSLVDATTGDRIWRKPLGVTEKTNFTGPITVVGDRFFLPHSSTETLASVNPDYECCQLSGAVSAHTLADGAQLWVHKTLSDPQKREISSAGTQLWGPAGASVWAAPVVDEGRGLVYVGTGPISAPPDEGTGDAIIAVDMETGERRWVFQATPGDFWNGACRAPHPGGRHPNCPGTDGVDFDFGAGLMRVTTPSGRDLLIAGQKSGTAHALDPDTGAVVWQATVGSGGLLGGIHWGMAYRDGALFVPVNDPDFTKHPGLSDNYKDRISPYTSNTGLYRLNVETGAVEWEWRPTRDCEPSFSNASAWPDCPPQNGLSGAILLAGDVSQVTYFGNVSYFPVEDTMFFATISTGFKSGGFNTDGTFPALTREQRIFGPEDTTNYEVGVKTQLFDNTLQLNATLYRMDIEGFQDRAFDGISFITRNVGELRQQGIETDFVWAPLDQLTFTGGLSYLDSEFLDYRDASPLPGGPVQDLTGSRAHFSPDWQGSLVADWTDDVSWFGGSQYFLRAETQYVGEQNIGANTNQNPQSIQDAYQLFNARIGLRGGDDRWEVNLFGKNLTDEGFCMTIFDQPFGPQFGGQDPVTNTIPQRCAVGAPQRFGVELKLRG